jgi:hypothetical protein
LELSIIGWRMICLWDVHAQTKLHRQPVGGLPSVLDEWAVLTVGPTCGNIVNVQLPSWLIQLIALVIGAAIRKVLDGVESVVAKFGATEQIVDLVLLELQTGFEGMIACVIRSGEEPSPTLGLDAVVMPVLIFTEVDGRRVVTACMDLNRGSGRQTCWYCR